MLEPVQENPFPDSHTLGEGPGPHPQLEPVLPLLGRWHGRGRGEYPTLEQDFAYEQEVSFSHDGRPFLRYEARAWLIDGSGKAVRPAGREAGWWRVMPDASLEVVLTHATGIVEVLVGRVAGEEIELETVDVARTPLAKEVTGTRRRYSMREDELMSVQEMAAVGQPMQHHLAARLRRA
ncbi:FABP family protein [Streptomyces sp. cmx-4-9]|uniref:FABP family protein n=1 Tax=Streptomyces sp. cmx-4-9 TaxID=2790941 RepID=UPI00397F990A